MTNLLKISFKNVILHWRQSLATTISLAAGLISLVMFQGYMLDVARMYQETFRSRMMYGDVIIQHQELNNPDGRAEPWNFSIKPEQQKLVTEFLKKYENKLIGVNRFLQVTGVVTNGKTSTIFSGFGMDIDSSEKIRGPEWAWNTLYGSPLSADKPETVLLGQSLGKFLGCRPEKKEKVMDAVAGYKPEVRPFHCDTHEVQLNITTPDGQLNAIDLEVTGLVDALYKDIDDKYLTISLPAAQELMNTPDISFISVKMKDSGSIVDDMIKDFNSFAESSNIPQRMVRWENHILGDMYVRTMSLLSIFRNFVVTIIVAIAALSIFNTMMKLVKERTREIGTLRSLGFLPGHILFIFMGEAVTLSIIGGLVGTVIAVAGTALVNVIGIVYKAGVLVEPVPFRILVNPTLYVVSFILLSILAMVITWLACRSTLKKTTAENLTYV